MYGVAPAYFHSRFGDRFACRLMAAPAGDVRGGGFDAIPTDVFHPRAPDECSHDGAASIRATRRRLSAVGRRPTRGSSSQRIFSN
jgi:hypothetical protein